MVILIGGVGYAGKTLMAQQLLEKYSYSSLSVDHLKMGLYRADIGCGFAPADSSKLIGDKLWPILKGIIMTCIENNQNLIIEGCYLLPKKINELGNEYLADVISFYLGFSMSYIERHFETKILKHRSVIEQRGELCDGWDTMERYILENEAQKEICEKSGAKYFEIQDDYEEEIKCVYGWIDGEISRKSDMQGTIYK
ncbi:MAG: 2-phosphoglycerate kinase [Defluviitaleaceae bacterium]|nr:2-phosphoglycerate kinase [Defluviitaleaceae bacterium]